MTAIPVLLNSYAAGHDRGGGPSARPLRDVRGQRGALAAPVERLYDEVITSGLCTGCAGCVIACPHDVIGYEHAPGAYKPFHLEEELGLDGAVPGARMGAALTIKAADRRVRKAVATFLGCTAALYGAGEFLALVYLRSTWRP